MAEEWLTIFEAAQLGNYHPNYVRQLIRKKKVEGRKYVTVWQVKRSSLLAYIRKTEKLGGRRGPKRVA